MITRRGFLLALASVPLLGRLAPKPKALAAGDIFTIQNRILAEPMWEPKYYSVTIPIYDSKGQLVTSAWSPSRPARTESGTDRPSQPSHR